MLKKAVSVAENFFPDSRANSACLFMHFILRAVFLLLLSEYLLKGNKEKPLFMCVFA